MADPTGAMDEGWLEESHYKMSKKIAQLTRVRKRVRARARRVGCSIAAGRRVLCALSAAAAFEC